MSETVRVRIAVAVNPEGDWRARGWRGADPLFMAGNARLEAGEEAVIYWLEAELPIPEQQTFKATVTPEASE